MVTANTCYTLGTAACMWIIRIGATAHFAGRKGLLGLVQLTSRADRALWLPRPLLPSLSLALTAAAAAECAELHG